MRGAMAATMVGLVGLFALPLALPSPALASGSLSMTGFQPTSGPVGTAVTITGTGFVSGDVVQFNGTTAASSTANRAGTTLKTSVPAFATSGPITVTDPSTGQSTGLPGTAFAITTGVSVTPSHAWAGAEVTVAGSALSPDQLEQIEIRNVLVGEALTDANGDFQVGVGVPWDEKAGKTAISVLDPNLGVLNVIIFILTSWPQLGFDGPKTADNVFEQALSTSSTAGLKLRWRTNLGDVLRTTPTVAGGLAYVGEGDDVVAMDVTTGSVVWTFPTADVVQSTPAVANGVVYVGSDDGNLYALGASDGHFIWRDPVGLVISSPLVADGVVYFGSATSGYVYALGASDGHFIWSRQTGGAVRSSPAIAKGVVYVGSDDHDLYALSAKTGQVLWTFTSGAEVQAQPTVSGGLVLVPGYDGFLRAVSVKTHQQVWIASEGDPSVNGVAVANGHVFLANDYFVKELDAATGTMLWEDDCNFCSPGPPSYANGVLYVRWGLSLNALDASTGNVLWSFTISGGDNGFTGEPAIAGDVVYASSVGNGPLGGSLWSFGL